MSFRPFLPRMANAKDMTTAATAGARLGVSSSDATLAALITAASSALAQWMGYPVHRREGVVESVVGRGGDYVWLASGAVRSIASVAVNGDVLATNLYALDGEAGALKGRLVARSGYCWPFTGNWTSGISATPLRARDTGEIIITFISGWVTPGQVAVTTYPSSDMPPELEQAVLEVVTSWWARQGQDAGITSMSVGAASVGWGGDSLQGGRIPLPLSARALAAPFRLPRGAR